MTRFLALAVGAFLSLNAACSAATPPLPASAAGEGLLTSLQVASAGDSVALVLQVTNTLTTPVEMNFSSAQLAEFVVTQANREIWRWSDDMMFAQAIRDSTLDEGETLRVEAFWVPGQVTGQLQATARLLAQGANVEQATTFTLP